MANIYIRLPRIICYFHRNYDVNNKLSNFDPIKFSPYTDHAVILRGGLVPVGNDNNKKVACYSQQQWKNILLGRNRDGTKQIIKRDSEEWPTFEEICLIEGRTLSNRTDSYDFLCIQIPKTIIVGNKEVRTNASYTLTREAANILKDLLVRDFKRALVDWEIGTQDFCVNEERVIRRGHMDTIERFLMRYDIPIPRDSIEKASIKRQLDRWLANARILEKAYRVREIEYEDPNDDVKQL